MTAGFEPDSSQGCLPFVVNFTNTSFPDSNINYTWNFGNSTYSNQKNPSAIYFTSGIFTVTLIIYNGINSDTIAKQITVYKLPQIDFSIDKTSGCAPLSVNFTDKSSGENCDIVYRLWNFGDGNNSKLMNPQHQYDTTGVYTVTLYIKDQFGCSNQIIKNNLITANKPIADFYAENTVSCNNPQVILFSNLSIGNQLIYYWDFGNGTNSSMPTPSAYYRNPGKYTVKLYVKDYLGCADTIVKNDLIVNSMTKSYFDIQDSHICLNTSPTIVNNSVNSNKYLWIFDDSIISNENLPKLVIRQSGVHKISLIASNNFGCIDTANYGFYVENIKADYTTTSNFECSLPATIYFVNKSINAEKYLWRFSNGETSININPNIIIKDQGYFSDTLIAINRFGCADTIVKDSLYSIVVPKAYFTPNNFIDVWDIKGCVPLTVNFKDKSNYETNKDSIIKWNWNFGDNSKSSIQNPSHIFNSLNSFLVSLSVTTKKGCTSEYSAWAKTGTQQHASFTFNSPDTICAKTPIHFFTTSQDSSLIDTYYWVFSDGTKTLTKDPIIYFQDTGFINVHLNVYYKGCGADTLVNKCIYVKGSYSKIESNFDCSNPYLFSFKGYLKDANNYFWDFGDGTPIDSINESPVHLYSAKNSYSVTLKTNNNTTGCDYNSVFKLKIFDAIAIFSTSQSNVCVGSTVSFNASNSLDKIVFKFGDKSCKYVWDFGDGSSKFASLYPIVEHKFVSEGDFNVKLLIKDSANCYDSAYTVVHVHKPKVNFILSQKDLCYYDTLKCSSTTTSYNSVKNYFWTFNNIDTCSGIEAKYLFSNAGLNNVKLSVIDTLGCYSELSKNVNIHKPNSDFYANKTRICTNDEVLFSFPTNQVPIITEVFDFGDSKSTSKFNYTHVYSDSGFFDLSRTITDTLGCFSTTTKISYINVQNYPIPDFTADSTFSTCYPLIVNFNNQTKGSYINNYLWYLTPNIASYSINPSNVYSVPGNYDVTLTAKTTNNCSAFLKKENFISVLGPYGQMIFDDTVCVNSNNLYSFVNKKNVYSFQWFFGDGINSSDSICLHKYTEAKKYVPIVYTVADSLNTCNKFFFDTIYIRNIQAGFQIDTNRGCIPFLLSVYDTTSYSLSRNWDFSNLATDSTKLSSYIFENAGNYDIKMFEKDKFGCLDTDSVQIKIFNLPTIQTIQDAQLCRGSKIQLYSSGGNVYNWQPSYNIENSNSQTPIVFPDTNFVYTVFVTDTNNCQNSKEVEVKVLQPPVFNVSDTSLIIGDSIILSNYYSDIDSYKWTPDYNISCDTCSSVYFYPLNTTTYSLTITDTAGCFTINKDFLIDVILKYSVDVPQAFTPNGDKINDEIFVEGWGIEQLVYFKIYNRFAELVFLSNDKQIGWDGVYKGIPQPAGVYTYSVAVKCYDGNILTKNGTIKLIR